MCQWLPPFCRLPPAACHTACSIAPTPVLAARMQSPRPDRDRTPSPNRIPAALRLAAWPVSPLRSCRRRDRVLLRPKLHLLPPFSPASQRCLYPLADPAIQQTPSSNAALHYAFRLAASFPRFGEGNKRRTNLRSKLLL